MANSIAIDALHWPRRHYFVAFAVADAVYVVAVAAAPTGWQFELIDATLVNALSNYYNRPAMSVGLDPIPPLLRYCSTVAVAVRFAVVVVVADVVAAVIAVAGAGLFPAVIPFQFRRDIDVPVSWLLSSKFAAARRRILQFHIGINDLSCSFPNQENLLRGPLSSKALSLEPFVCPRDKANNNETLCQSEFSFVLSAGSTHTKWSECDK